MPVDKNVLDPDPVWISVFLKPEAEYPKLFENLLYVSLQFRFVLRNIFFETLYKNLDEVMYVEVMYVSHVSCRFASHHVSRKRKGSNFRDKQETSTRKAVCR